jgi:hypothetical protein
VREDGKPPIEPSSDVSPPFVGIQFRVSETAHDSILVAEGGKSTSAESSNTPSKESSSQLADDSVSDDEAKNDSSFHSAPEVQPDSVQVEAQSKIGDKTMSSKWGALH